MENIDLYAFWMQLFGISLTRLSHLSVHGTVAGPAPQFRGVLRLTDSPPRNPGNRTAQDEA